MAGDTWQGIAVPIIELAAGPRSGWAKRQIGDLADQIGCTAQEFHDELELLARGGYLEAEIQGWGSDRGFVSRLQVLERGARQVGRWPHDELVGAFLAILDQRIESEPDPDERTKLRKLRQAVVDVGVSAAGSILANLASSGLG